MRSFEIETDLAAPAEAVWRRVTTQQGINDELLPVLRMTMPRALRGITIGDAPVGENLGRSWLLIFGLIPVDFDDLTIAELEPGRRFLEQSTMLTQSRWRHERIVESHGSGCRVTDRLGWQGRARALGALFGLAVPVIFRHRHRRLRRRFGAAPALGRGGA
jgi:ligand-binding SRPBCC domain-containing protein